MLTLPLRKFEFPDGPRRRPTAFPRRGLADREGEPEVR